MKKILLSVFILVLSITLVGCGNKKIEENKLQIDCNGDNFKIDIEENAIFQCTLTDQEYDLTIKNVKDNSLTIEVSDYGLALVKEDGTISLLDYEKEFNLPKNKEIKLRTQTTDYSEDVSISWR